MANIVEEARRRFQEARKRREREATGERPAPRVKKAGPTDAQEIERIFRRLEREKVQEKVRAATARRRAAAKKPVKRIRRGRRRPAPFTDRTRF